jgi:hypothetical protein
LNGSVNGHPHRWVKLHNFINSPTTSYMHTSQIIPCTRQSATSFTFCTHTEHFEK